MNSRRIGKEMDTSLIPQDALREVIRTLDIGLKKYPKNDWVERYSENELIRKVRSHLARWKFHTSSGIRERYDQEDGQHHLAACIVHLLGLLQKNLEEHGENKQD